MNLIFHLIYRLPQIYEEFYHTVNNADHEKDLKWWSNTYGVNMPMNWPQFEVKYFRKLMLYFSLSMHVFFKSKNRSPNYELKGLFTNACFFSVFSLSFLNVSAPPFLRKNT